MYVTDTIAQQRAVTILPDSPGRLRDDMASPQPRLCLLVSGGLPDLPPTAMPWDMGRDLEVRPSARLGPLGRR